MTLRELNEKRNRLLSEARTQMQATNLTAEQRGAVDAMLTDAQALKADIERLEACAVTEERSLPNGRPQRDNIDASEAAEVDERTTEQRNRASNVALRAFLRGERFEQRDLTVASEGGIMIPVAALQPIQATRSAGSIYDIVKHLRTTTGEPVRVPLWDDTANLCVLDSVAIGNGTDPSTTGLTIQVDGLRTGDPLLIDNKLLQDLSYDLIADVNASLNQRWQVSMAKFIAQGNGSNFTGLNGNVPTPVTTETAGTLGYDDFVALITALDPSYAMNACFSFSTATLGAVLKIKDGEGRPIFIPYLDGATSGFAGQILGYPVKINQFAPAVATGNVPVIFGNHEAGYTLREILPGLVIKQSAQRWIELNRLGVIGFGRAGGAPTLANTAAFSPLVGLKVQ